ncbi:MFS transporter [Paenibacillus oleatilyticus]|uniref:MFS transporter n=1 Tax=Paenibacillus oleatilyticus TaxID=2594886 RepID=UPI001C1FB145|nr:MFS transporter [Paenibacillus oleatilyticus]MBU7314117.1 MFS transporter [Paenibacillus oleatilyticus]
MDLNSTKVKRIPIMVTLMMGAFVATLNETLLGNALPVLMKEFQVGATTIQWLTEAYLLVVGALIPVTALIQQWLTTRQLFFTAMMLLLTGRVIQAIGTGLIIPLLMNTLLIMYPAEKRGSIMGVLFLIFTFAPAIGPTLSGIIIDAWDWPWLFYIIIPITIVSIIIGYYYLVNVTVALVLVPVQTYGLNQITPEYYADGSAIFSTLQQVAGAIGTSLFIATMSARSHNHLAQSANPNDVTEQLTASVAGYSDMFMLGFIISIIAVVVSLFLRKNAKEKQAN